MKLKWMSNIRKGRSGIDLLCTWIWLTSLWVAVKTNAPTIIRATNWQLPNANDMWTLWNENRCSLPTCSLYIIQYIYRGQLLLSTYLTGTMTSKLTTALKNDSNFDPSTVNCIFAWSAVISMQVAALAATSDDRADSAGIASKCCSSWYSEPISIKYLIVLRMINNALNACQMCRLLKIEHKYKSIFVHWTSPFIYIYIFTYLYQIIPINR